MNEILLTGLAVAVIVMIALDIIEKVQAYRIKKIENKHEMFDAKQVEPSVKPEMVGPIKPIKAKFRIDNTGMTPDEIEARLIDLISQELTTDLIDIRVYEDYEMRMQVVEGTLRVIRPKKLVTTSI